MFDPNYWQQEAQKYAASLAGTANAPKAGHQAPVTAPPPMAEIPASQQENDDTPG